MEATECANPRQNTRLWLKAADRYEAAKRPGFKKRKKRKKTIVADPKLPEFLESEEGKAGLKLPAATGFRITLTGVGPQGTGRFAEIQLTHEGFVHVSGVGGMAAAYANEKPTRTPIVVGEAAKRLSDMWRSSDKEDEDRSDMDKLLGNWVPCIRSKLTEIAKDMP